MIDPNEKLRTVELVAYSPHWAELFSIEASEIKVILGSNCLAVHHIGSTAIPDIYAKPIIDILPIVKDITAVDVLNAEFEALGYTCMGEYGIPGRRFYWKSKDKRTHHIHLFQKGAAEINRHVMFKDFMIANPDYAKAYSLIKLNLAEVFPTDIENYVNGKASFIQMIEYKIGAARSAQLEAIDNIVIESYKPAWPKLALAEIETIKKLSQLPFVTMEHLGSTAVPELASKPIIDIFISINNIKDATQWIKPLETLGYVFWHENPDKSHLRFFKGMPPYGMKRTHHIHIIDEENTMMEQRILFRDILRRDAKIRMAYDALKLKLSNVYSSDREAYTNSKSEFIEKTLRSAGYLKPIAR